MTRRPASVARPGEEQRSSDSDLLLGLVAHELRTPVTTVYGNAKLLLDRYDTLPDADRRQALVDIEAESERLCRLIETMLLLAGTRDEHVRHLEPLDVGAILERACTDHRRRFPGRSVELRIEPGLRNVLGVSAFVEQIALNYLGNAEKYGGGSQAPIEINVRQRLHEAHVLVLDRGPGVAMRDMNRLFTSFFRSESTSGLAPGVGLGLAACKRLAEAQGGAVWAHARDGGGAEFSFSLRSVAAV